MRRLAVEKLNASPPLSLDQARVIELPPVSFRRQKAIRLLRPIVRAPGEPVESVDTDAGCRDHYSYKSQTVRPLTKRIAGPSCSRPLGYRGAFLDVGGIKRALNGKRSLDRLDLVGVNYYQCAAVFSELHLQSPPPSAVHRSALCNDNPDLPVSQHHLSADRDAVKVHQAHFPCEYPKPHWSRNGGCLTHPAALGCGGLCWPFRCRLLESALGRKNRGSDDDDRIGVATGGERSPGYR